MTSIYIIGGPTASGKSEYALNLAKRINGEIINGDSMQVYSHLCILTARPTDLQGIPHHLYGVLQGNETCSVAWWYAEACKVIQSIQARGIIPIIVGGTGLYLRALTHGLSPIPTIPDTIRQEARQLAQSLSEAEFFSLVQKEDPKIAQILHQNDRQRLLRALEVVRTTGNSILEYQGHAKRILNIDYQYFILMPPREILYARINTRFAWMVENGAIKEVENLLSQQINDDSPILKAVGARELQAYLMSELTKVEAIAAGQQSTRRYAKRQITWFTHQAPEAQVIS